MVNGPIFWVLLQHGGSLRRKMFPKKRFHWRRNHKSEKHVSVDVRFSETVSRRNKYTVLLNLPSEYDVKRKLCSVICNVEWVLLSLLAHNRMHNWGIGTLIHTVDSPNVCRRKQRETNYYRNEEIWIGFFSVFMFSPNSLWPKHKRRIQCPLAPHQAHEHKDTTRYYHSKHFNQMFHSPCEVILNLEMQIYISLIKYLNKEYLLLFVTRQRWNSRR